jgi:hypothetical protein
MTPAARKKAHPKTAEIKASNGGTVKVDRVTDDRVTVTWACGDTRDFTPEGLRNAITNFETIMVHTNAVPIWMEDADHAHRRFSCRLQDGRFHADATATEEAYSVPWSTFKRALEARAK